MLMTDRLKAARKELKLTQEQVAFMLGVDRSTYAYYEGGTSNPSLENLIKLGSIFGVEVDWLIGADRPQNAFCAPEDMFDLKMAINEKRVGELTPEEKKVVGLYRIAKANGKEDELFSFIKKMAEELK